MTETTKTRIAVVGCGVMAALGLALYMLVPSWSAPFYGLLLMAASAACAGMLTLLGSSRLAVRFRRRLGSASTLVAGAAFGLAGGALCFVVLDWLTQGGEMLLVLIPVGVVVGAIAAHLVRPRRVPAGERSRD